VTNLLLKTAKSSSAMSGCSSRIFGSFLISSFTFVVSSIFNTCFSVFSFFLSVLFLLFVVEFGGFIYLWFCVCVCGLFPVFARDFLRVHFEGDACL